MYIVLGKKRTFWAPGTEEQYFILNKTFPGPFKIEEGKYPAVVLNMIDLAITNGDLISFNTKEEAEAYLASIPDYPAWLEHYYKRAKLALDLEEEEKILGIIDRFTKKNFIIVPRFQRRTLSSTDFLKIFIEVEEKNKNRSHILAALKEKRESLLLEIAEEGFQETDKAFLNKTYHDIISANSVKEEDDYLVVNVDL